MPLGLLLSLAASAAPAEDFVLDEYDWYECTPPSDDTWIIRQTRGRSITYVWYFQPEPRPGYLSFMMQFEGLSMPSPVEQDYTRFLLYLDHNPYEIETFWFLSSAADHPTTSLQNEFHYGWGDPWPEKFYTHQQSVDHTLSGKLGAYNTRLSGSISNFCRWDDRTYPDLLPEDCFVGWTLCFSHLRPDRVVFNWTIDASLASRYREALPKPVMMLHDEADIYVPFLVDPYRLEDRLTLEYDWVNLVPTGWEDGVWSYRLFGDKRLALYYSGSTFEEVWSSLDSGADE